MAFIPSGARWYLADVVLEITVEGDPRNLVHVNTLLVEAGSPEEAYEKALALGRQQESEYPNTDGKQVRFVFRGLRQLSVMYDPLENGAELCYEELADVPRAEMRRLVTPKRKLNVFAPMPDRPRGLNYMPEHIMQALEAAGFDRADVLGKRGQRGRNRRKPP